MDVEISPLRILVQEIEAIARGAVALAPNLVAGLVVLILTWILAKVLSWSYGRVMRRSSFRPSLVAALRTMIVIGVWVGGILLAAVVAFPNLTPTKLLAGLGIGSIAVGLAFKDIFENFLAGLLILLRKPMRIGDHIECEGVEGEVTEITIRDTHIRKTDGTLVMVPNGFIYKNPCRVLTDLDRRRTTIIVGVAYGEDVDESRKVITAAVEGLETVDGNKPVQIFAREFNSSSIDFEVTWWTGSKPVDVRQSRDEVVAAVKAALDEAGIEIPFPYRTLTFKEPLALSRATGETENAA